MVLSCEEIKAKMDQFDGSGSGGMYEAAGYLALWAAAKIQGCSFLDSLNPYHEDPQKGGRGKLERQRRSNESGYSPFIMLCEFEYFGHLERMLGGTTDRHLAGEFHFVPAGRLLNGAGEQVYFLAVADGPYAGYIVSRYIDYPKYGDSSFLQAKPPSENADRWTMYEYDDNDGGYSGWEFSCHDIPHGAHGAMDMHDNGTVSDQKNIWGADNACQRWLFRPPNFH
ncbi:hypothetical protein ACIBK8_22605 [Streptomyces sp. NPDC050161]|uniref:hypothetical protein n=1 Tax=Streptomyces sp. NPDC050161 TaxID=3365604 RepID=UPI003789EE95